MWQAAIILGATDFLGNPLGFVNDLSEGMSGLLMDGNVRALVQNVTHGLSNSAAKVSGRSLQNYYVYLALFNFIHFVFLI